MQSRQAEQTGKATGAPADNWQASFQAPSVNLPKGGGALKGMGEKFAANPSTGTRLPVLPFASAKK